MRLWKRYLIILVWDAPILTKDSLTTLWCSVCFYDGAKFGRLSQFSCLLLSFGDIKRISIFHIWWKETQGWKNTIPDIGKLKALNWVSLSMSCDISLKLSPKKGSKTTTTMIKFTVKTHQQVRSESEENETQSQV